MYCPECRSEYREGIEQCAHCEVGLVADLPAQDAFSSPERMAAALRDVELEAVLVGNHVALREGQSALAGTRIASVIAGESDEVEPGMHARFYLMVATDEVSAARAFFEQRWRTGLAQEGTLLEASASGDAETTEGGCPACDAVVPDDAQECPDCGLFVGGS